MAFPSGWFVGQRLKGGDDVKEFLVDATLAQLVEVFIEVRKWEALFFS